MERATNRKRERKDVAVEGSDGKRRAKTDLQELAAGELDSMETAIQESERERIGFENERLELEKARLEADREERTRDWEARREEFREQQSTALEKFKLMLEVLKAEK